MLIFYLPAQMSDFCYRFGGCVTRTMKFRNTLNAGYKDPKA